jgi:glyoxylase-like metal-dependent hydrolase (beta-lactamase superfamily II)
MSEQAKMFGIQIKQSPNPDKFITDETILTLGEIKPKFLFTPGHTPGEYSIYFEEDKICITGDVLFKEGIGRTDLWGGNYDTLIESIRTQLLTLPEDTVIYPGHGEDSTISDEIKLNPFLIDV